MPISGANSALDRTQMESEADLALQLLLPDGRCRRLGTVMSRILVVLSSLIVGPATACTDLPPANVPDDEALTVACGNNITSANSILDWQLFVEPRSIVAGEDFSASLSGIATFGEDFLDEAQSVIRGGVREVNLVELNATVHVRSGAIGIDVVLAPDPDEYEYTCREDNADCDPENGNDDCNQGNGFNPCGRFVILPIAADCDPDGICSELGKTGDASQCAVNDFCITGDLEIKLGEQTGRYRASPAGGVVLFGWADESTGFEVRDSGPNEGTWILTMPEFSDPTGPVGLRVTAGGFPVALECTMGVDSRGEDGCDSLDFLSCPTPNNALISFPIEPAF